MIETIKTIPGLQVSDVRMTADYLGTDPETIKKIIRSYKENLSQNGMITLRPNDFRKSGMTMLKSGKRGMSLFQSESGETFEIPNYGIKCFNADAVSLVENLLNEHNAENAVESTEINTENVSETTEIPTKNVNENPIANLFKTFFYKEESPVRIVIENGEPWFVAADVCNILDVKNPTQAIDRLDEDERAMFNIGRQGETNIISEPGLYSLVLGSRKPEAKEFKRWITHEVIPTLRNTGGYVADPEQLVSYYFNDLDPNVKTIITGAFTTIKQLQDENAELARSNETLEQINKLLADGINTWDNRAMLNAMIRAASGRYKDDFKRTWNTFYKRLTYTSGISLKLREGNGKLIDKIQNEEWITVLQTAAAWLIELHISVETVINTVNAATIMV